MIDEEECRSRIRHAQENDICNFYMLTLDKVQQLLHCIDVCLSVAVTEVIFVLFCFSLNHHPLFLFVYLIITSMRH